MPAKLVCDALHMAVQQRRPSAGLVVHSDRGSQYASAQYQAQLAGHGFICSMRRKGNCRESKHCFDAVAERFFLNLKMERVWQRDYASHAGGQNRYRQLHRRLLQQRTPALSSGQSAALRP